jgi:hypothetical protein
MMDLVELEMTGVKDSFRGEVVNIQQFDQVMCFRPPTRLRDTTVETSTLNRGHSGTGSIALHVPMQCQVARLSGQWMASVTA